MINKNLDRLKSKNELKVARGSKVLGVEAELCR